MLAQHEIKESLVSESLIERKHDTDVSCKLKAGVSELLHCRKGDAHVGKSQNEFKKCHQGIDSLSEGLGRLSTVENTGKLSKRILGS